MNLGKVDSLEKILKEYLTGKTLVSKNGVEILKPIHKVKNVETKELNLFSVDLVLFSFDDGFEKLKAMISFNHLYKGDDLILCPTFSENFSSKKLPNYGEIIKIDEFRSSVEAGAFIDSDGSGDILLKDGSFVSASLRVNELADLIYHPRVEGIIWYNK